MSLVDLISFLPNWAWGKWTTSIPYPTDSFLGQTVIVTGASNGLGLEAARHFTRLKATKVILAVRNIEKGEATKKSIEESTKTQGVVEVWQLDLSSHESVKQFAAKAKGLPRLDVLLQNAGISQLYWAEADGDEETITVNVISVLLLSALLMPKLKETAVKFNVRPHLVIVSSELHLVTALPERKDPSGSILGTLRDKSKAKLTGRYNVSKLMEVFAVRQLAEDHANEDYPVIINAINPGLCRSGLLPRATNGFVASLLYFVAGARSTEVGSRTLVHAASIGPESHGQYLSDCKITPSSHFVRSEEGKKTQKRVWTELKERLEEIEPGVTKDL